MGGAALLVDDVELWGMPTEPTATPTQTATATPEALSGESSVEVGITSELGLFDSVSAQAYETALGAVSQSLIFIQNFDTNPPGPNEAIASPSVSGSPIIDIGTVSNVPTPPAARGQMMVPGTGSITLEVNLVLGDDVNKAYRVVGFAFYYPYYIFPATAAREHEIIFQLKNRSGAILHAQVCRYIPGEAPCTLSPIPAGGVDGVRTVTIIHRMFAQTILGASDIYRLGLDSIRIQTDQYTTLPLPACTQAVVNSTAGTGRVRSQPVTGNVLGDIPNGQILPVLGRNGSWYYVQYDPNNPANKGWISDEVIDLDKNWCGEGQITPLNPDGSPLTLATFDAVLPTPPADWNPEALNPTLICQNNEATRQNCSKIVYYVYYYDFITAYGEIPKLSDFLTTIYANEMARAGIDNPLSRAAVANSFWGHIKGRSNCAGDDAACRTALADLEILTAYLAGVESWYNKANLGKPHGGNIDGGSNGTDMLIDDHTRGYRTAGNEFLQSKNPGCGGSGACAWGNYGYGSLASAGVLNYSLINNNNNPPVLFCQTVRSFTEIEDADNATHPSDEWFEYRFAITTTSVGKTSVYRYTDGTPAWLGNDARVEDKQGNKYLARSRFDLLDDGCPYP
jgi:hypothetical protein